MVLVRRFDCHFKALLAQLPLCRLRNGFAGEVKREVRLVRLRENQSRTARGKTTPWRLGLDYLAMIQ